MRRFPSFPFVILFLTSALVLFMVLSFTYQSPQRAQTKTPEVTKTVSTQEYETELHGVFQALKDRLLETATVEEQKTIIDEALTKLIALRVPIEYKQTHLNLAILLSQIKTLLQQDQSIDASLNQLFEIVDAI